MGTRTSRRCSKVKRNLEIEDKSLFESIGGLTECITTLKEMVFFPLLYPAIFEGDSEVAKGVVFFGPPGTGKTLLARALVNEINRTEGITEKITFIPTNSAECISKWVGESEKNIAELFRKAKEAQPAVIFFDELDGLAPTRRDRDEPLHASIVSTLLSELDGLKGRGRVMVIGTTNRLEMIDPALLRPGRFERTLFVPLPSQEDRERILTIHAREMNVKASVIRQIALDTDGFSGADLKFVCATARGLARRRIYPDIYAGKGQPKTKITPLQVLESDMNAAVQQVSANIITVNSVHHPLPELLKPLLQESLNAAVETLSSKVPALMKNNGYSNSHHRVSQGVAVRLLLAGPKGVCHYLGPALLEKIQNIPLILLDSTSICHISIQIRRDTILYVPDIELLFATLSLRGEQFDLVKILCNLPPSVILIATSNVPFNQLDSSIQEQFHKELNDIFEVQSHKYEDRLQMFQKAEDTRDIDIVTSEMNSPKKRKVGTAVVTNSVGGTLDLETLAELTESSPVDVLLSISNQISQGFQKSVRKTMDYLNKTRENVNTI